MENPIEKGPERILSKEEVLEVLNRFESNPTITRELVDENGLYMLEATGPGHKPGVTIEYVYLRKGKFPGFSTPETAINRMYYENGVPYTGNTASVYNPTMDQWEDQE